MACTTAAHHPDSLLGVATGPLELRVVGTSLAGQTVKLHAAKCTIGSSRRCTLRLQARRIEPVHCLIVRGERETIVRRWSAQTRLNGAAFTDAALHQGDRLTIGPIELEVVATGQASVEAAPAENPASKILAERGEAAASPVESQSQTSLLQHEAEYPQREADLSQRERLLKERLTEFERRQAEQQEQLSDQQAKWAARLAEHEDLTHELNNLRQLQLDLPDLLEDRRQYEQRRAELASGEAALAAARAAWNEDSQAREATGDERRDQIETRLAELDQQQAALEQKTQTLADQQAAFETQRRAAEEAFAQQEAELLDQRRERDAQSTAREQAIEALANDLAQREEAFRAAQADWSSQRAAWELASQEATAELQRQQAELEQARQAFDEHQAEVQTRLDESDSPQPKLLEASPAALELCPVELTKPWSSAEPEHPCLESIAEAEIVQGGETRRGEPSSNSEPKPFEPLYSLQEMQAALADSPANERNFFVVEKADEAKADDAEACEDQAFEAEAADGEQVVTLPWRWQDDETALDPPAQTLERQARAEERFAIENDDVQPVDEPGQASSHPEAKDQEEDASERAPSLSEQIIRDMLEERQQLSDVESRSATREVESAPASSASMSKDQEPLEFAEPAQSSPAESSGLMERLRSMAGWEEDEASSDVSPLAAGSSPFEPARSLTAEDARPVYSQAEAGGKAASHAAGADDEESIEEYMAKLMSRVRGEAAPPKPSYTPPKPMPETPAREEREHLAESPEEPALAPQKPFEMAPRQHPPELSSNLAAMRELANFTARDAIDTSLRNRWSQAALGKFSVAGIAALAAGILLFWTRDPYSLTFLGSGVAMLVAVFWGLQGAVILRNVRLANQVLADKVSATEQETVALRHALYDEPEGAPSLAESRSASEEPIDADVEVVDCEEQP